MPSFCNIFTSQSTWVKVITVLCFFFGLATAPVLLTKWDGTVSSPNYPFTYPTNTTLTWIKTVSSGNRITITIDDFQVRNSENLSQPAPRRSKYSQLDKNHAWIGYPLSSLVANWKWAIASNDDYVINGSPRSGSNRKNRRSCFAG